jgi:hypothetical protein
MLRLLPIPFVLAFGLVPARAAEPSVDELNRKMMESANGLRNYHVKFRFLKTELKSGSPERIVQHRLIEAWRLEGKQRYDETELDASGDPLTSDPYTWMRCRNCIREGQSVVYHYLKSAVKTELNDSDYMKLTHKNEYPDMLALGHQWYGLYMWHRDGANGFWAKLPLMKFSGVEREGTGNCWVIRAAFNAESQVRYRINADRGYTVDYFESKAIVEGVHHRRWIESEYQQSDGGFWYPRSNTFRVEESQDGQKTWRQEVITVLEADFKRPIDPKVFTYEGFHLKVGTTMSLKPGDVANADKVWSGTAPVDPKDLHRPPVESIKRAPVPVAEEPQPAALLPSTNRWIYYTVAGGLVLSGLVLFFFRRRS